MKIAICDDERIFSDMLCTELQSYFAAHRIPLTICSFAKGSALLQKLNEVMPELIFMDIMLNEEEDGVEVIGRLREAGCDIPVIFLSSMEDRVLDGYDVKAFGFLYKRNFKEKLGKVLDRFLKERELQDRFTVNSTLGLERIAVGDILWLEADKRHTLIHKVSGITDSGESVQNLAANLPEEMFIETYHCVFVNIDHISRVEADSVKLDNGETLPMSRRKRKEVLNAVMNRIGE